MKNFSNALLNWFDEHGRKHLPWQENITPYRVWVSEIMLQQTQVSTVIPYYLNFMQRFPELNTLALADLDMVLSYWTGLGYYARARNLHKTAQIVATKHQGQFPGDFTELINLPGIGRSTAGAILSIAFEIPTPILDGNVKRVLCRYHAIEKPLTDKTTETYLWNMAEQYTSHTRPRDYTQAIMDLGATLCIRTTPLCQLCPLKDSCQAHLQGKVLKYPIVNKKKKIPVKKTFFLILYDADHKILLEKRPATGIWGGLWSFPECLSYDEILDICQKNFSCVIDTMQKAPTFRHTFSHFHLVITPIYLKIKEKILMMMDSDRHVWYKLEEIDQLGVSTPVKTLIKELAFTLRS